MKPPLEMPTDFYSQVEFDILRVDYSAPEGSGRQGGVQAGFPLFYAVYTLDVVGPDETDEIIAFKDQARGQTRRFLGRDLTRPYPKAYPRGFAGMTRPDASPFDGTATAWSEAINADGDSLVTLEGLPAGFELGKRDYIGFHWVATSADIAGLTWHACVRVNVVGIADGDGTVTVTCNPPIPDAVPAGAVAYLNQPACVMVLVSDQTKLGPIGKRLALQSGQLGGLQDIRV